MDGVESTTSSEANGSGAGAPISRWCPGEHDGQWGGEGRPGRLFGGGPGRLILLALHGAFARWLALLSCVAVLGMLPGEAGTARPMCSGLAGLASES